MAEVEKGKKKGRRAEMVTEHRSRRVVVYTNRNKPVVSDVAGAVPHFEDEAEECAVPDVDKGTGNPVNISGGRNLTDRTSAPVTAGHQSPSTGDHGAWQDPMTPVGPREMAFRHPDMRQSTTSAFPFSMLQSYNGSDEYGDRSVTLGAGRVSLQRLDAAGAAGLPGPSGNPASRWTDHQSRGSATPPNGGHSVSNPTSTPPMSMKNSDHVSLMRVMLFGGHA